MNEANFVKRMNWIATGDSFLREMMLTWAHFMEVSTPDVIDNGSAPTLLINGIGFAGGETASVTFMLPMDYDRDSDRMALKLAVDPDGNASDFGLLTTKLLWREGVIESNTAGTAVAETSITTASLVRVVHLAMSGDSHRAGDVIQRTVDMNGTVASVLAASIIYGACFAAYTTADRHRDLTATTQA